MCRCGSGLSGEALTDAGHYWVGVDISKSMLGKFSVDSQSVRSSMTEQSVLSSQSFYFSYLLTDSLKISFCIVE